MTRKRFHGLRKVKVRATWNKYNLYNLARLRSPPVAFQTFYQQKWAAKSISRAYHGEHVREGQWERMFRPRMAAVVPMDYKYLAEHDGSEHAAGRGSGKEKPLNMEKIRFGQRQIPYMHMTYAPLERRLDMAVWRSLFASSARQARQFCIHGKVTVNGQKMPYAGYLLNPGDMFQVEPDSVLFATGKEKPDNAIRAGKEIRRKRAKIWKRVGKLRLEPPSIVKKDPRVQKSPESDGKAAPGSESVAPAKPQKSVELVRAERKLVLDQMLIDAQTILNKGERKIGAKGKQAWRAHMRNIKHVRANLNRKTEEELDDAIKEFTKGAVIANRAGKTAILEAKHKEKTGRERKAPTENSTAKYERTLEVTAAQRYEDEYKNFRDKGDDNPVDYTKAYATPWEPRPYMSPFAFIPRYLEVNQKICSAVYLRHPVARPGMSEVPSPFGADTQQLAFNWYLRRR